MEYTINGKTYNVIDSLERIPTKDSFTNVKNKLGNGAGAWEWHIGSKNDTERYNFFGGRRFNSRCFLLKKDLVWLMNEMQTEYFNPTYRYRESNDFRNIWRERMNEIQNLPEVAFFALREHDGRDPNDMRLYAKRPGEDAEGDHIYGLLRKVALPETTFTSILKLRADDGDELFYFKIFPESIKMRSQVEEDKEIEEEIRNNDEISDTETTQIIKSRIGQGIFRSKLIIDCGYCPITMVDDSRLLIASHIKPWRNSDNSERLNPMNGLLLTPTYDHLFDNGFFSFNQDKLLLVSPWLSNENTRRLSIQSGMQINNLPIIGREDFIDFHKNKIFRN
ncbi:MAG: HNH endonuclease [Balneolaceae bacterium]|nr:HNH endonuclease [Balneolaceae bacterium]